MGFARKIKFNRVKCTYTMGKVVQVFGNPEATSFTKLNFFAFSEQLFLTVFVHVVCLIVCFLSRTTSPCLLC